MKNFVSTLFEREKHPVKGLLAAEWAMMVYLVLTLLLMLFLQTKVVNPESMLLGRVRIVATTVAMWGVYRLWPCRLVRLARVVVQLALLGWWYPDTYEFNRLFPNLDHLFATAEQTLFGCHPALLLSKVCSHPVISELMDLGYSSYYPLIGLVVLVYFLKRSQELDRTAFIVLGAFYVYYVIFIFVPVAGPQYYYLAAGVDNIAAGVFPSLGDYFMTHRESIPNPGWPDGFFFQCVLDAHNAGERPTAAFPSSHVGVSTILMLLAWRLHNRRFFVLLVPFYVLLCLSTVYIQAHYAVDVIGGWVSAVAIYLFLSWGYDRFAARR